MSSYTIADFTDSILTSDYPHFVRLLRKLYSEARLFKSISVELTSGINSISVNAGITSIKVLSLVSAELDTISGGNIGDIVILYFASPIITVPHLQGNIQLSGDPALPDFPAGIGDVLILLNTGTGWVEVWRTLAAAVWLDYEAWLDDVTWGD